MYIVAIIHFVIDFSLICSLYSDGMGRTGAFCAAFTILERVKAEQVVDVFSTVKSLRIQRPGLLESLVSADIITLLY